MARKSKADKYREAQKQKEPEVFTNLEDFAAMLVDDRGRPRELRKLNPTQKEVLFSNAPFNLYMGAAGAAKTSTICAAGWLRTMFQPGSVGLVCRHDYNKLMMTTHNTMSKMLHKLPPDTLLERDKSAPEHWTIKPAVEGPPSHIYFSGLKDEVVGFQIDWCLIDEVNEVEESRIQELKLRLRNEIPGMPEDVDATGMYLACNAPDKTHWLYTAATGKNAKEQIIAKPYLKLFQPRYKENAANLRKGYYEEREADLPEDLKQRFVMGDWGMVFPGAAVYRQFSQFTHVKRDLEFDRYSTLYRFWDFGYNAPACVFAQLDIAGRLRALYEHIGAKVGIQDFAKRVKQETAMNFRGHRADIRDFGDPAVIQKKDTGSTLQELAAEGITMNYKVTKIMGGVNTIRTRLGLLIEGEPALQFDEVGCPTLISAMKGGYHMNNAGTEPKKDGFYEHVSDAYRYGVVNLIGTTDVESSGVQQAGNLGYGGAY